MGRKRAADESKMVCAVAVRQKSSWRSVAFDAIVFADGLLCFWRC